MRPLKKILKAEATRRFLCWIGSLYIRFVHATCRWSETGGAEARQRQKDGKPFIACFWHGRMLMMTYSWQHEVPFHMLISQHRDGQIIARTIGHLGIETIAGSTSRGGSQALRSILKTLKQGEYIGITPDGPRGPRMRASTGIVNIARMAGVPIFPITYGTTRRRVLGTWDRFIIPLPFARGVYVWGDRVDVPRDAGEAEIEDARLKVESILNQICDEADRLSGQPTIEPAPAVEPELDTATGGAVP